MSDRIKTLIYGDPGECADAEAVLRSLEPLLGFGMEFRYSHCHDDFREQLPQWKPGLSLVLPNGAEGMEGVFAVKEHHPNSLVFWFSDDQGFGMMSYRLECDYFSVKPVTKEKIIRAFRRCAHVNPFV